MIGAANAAAIEGNDVTFTVTLTPASGKQVTVTWSASTVALRDDTATTGSDYTYAEQELTFAAGDTTKTVTVATIDDALDEEDAETFTLTLLVPVNATFAGGTRFSQATGTINDNDDPPTLTVMEVSAEEGEDLTFTVELSAESGRQVTVIWTASIGSDDTAVAADFADLSEATGTLTFTGVTAVYDEDGVLETTTVGETETTFTVSTTEDTTFESDETFTVTLSSASHATLATDPTATGTITDDDALPTLSVDDATASEGRDVAFTVRLSPASGREVTAIWTASIGSGDTAVAADFADLSAATGTLTIAAGDTTATVAVATASDRVTESAETFTLTLSSPRNAELADATAQGTINDADPTDVALASLALSDVELTPPFAAETLSYTGAVNTGVASTTVTAAAREPAADVEIGPDDADDSANGHQVALNLAAGATRDITVTVTSVNGSARTYTVTVTGVNPNAPQAKLRHLREITDASGDPDSVTDVRLEFTMYLYFLRHGSPVGFTMDDVVVHNGSVETFERLERGTSGFFWYRAGIAVDTGAAEVTVAIPPNVIDGGNHPAQRTFTVDAEGPAIEFDVSVGEDEVVTDTFVVTIGFGEPIYQHDDELESVNPDAVYWNASQDIRIIQGGSLGAELLVPADRNARQVTVHPTSDYEGELTFRVRAGAVQDVAGNRNAAAEFTRTVDTRAPSVTAIDITSGPAHPLGYGYAAGEVITLDVIFHEPVTVAGTPLPYFDLEVGEETRQAGYVSGTGTATLSFAYTVLAADADTDGIGYAADSIELNGATIRDAVEHDADLSHAKLDAAPAHQVNTSAPEVGFAAATASADEGEAVEFEVSLSAASALQVTVQVATTDGTATTGDDFTAVSETLTFAPGETTETVSVPTIVDTAEEMAETFTVTLSNPEYATISDATATATGTITDADALPNTAPVITTTSPVAVAENGTAVATLAATDADGDPIAWSKTGGADADRFALSAQGVLTFKAEPDYESPADVASADPANDAENNEYVVFVTASDGTNDTELQLVVRVTNANDAPTGTVTIDDTSPMIGDVLTASAAAVADQDGLPDPFAPAWQWYRTPTDGSETEIDRATAATYTVVRADYDATLTAKATWTDNGGFTNTLASAATEVTPRPSCTQNPGDLWCGVVTVEWYEPLSAYGYVPAFGSDPQVGDLSNKNFSFREMSYTIDLILVERKTGDSFFEGVYFSLTSPLAEDDRVALVLYIGPTSRPPSTPSGDTSLSSISAAGIIGRIPIRTVGWVTRGARPAASAIQVWWITAPVWTGRTRRRSRCGCGRTRRRCSCRRGRSPWTRTKRRWAR